MSLRFYSGLGSRKRISRKNMVFQITDGLFQSGTQLLEYYRALARKKRTLPHNLVRAMAEKVAEPAIVVLGRMGLDLSRPG